MLLQLFQKPIFLVCVRVCVCVCVLILVLLLHTTFLSLLQMFPNISQSYCAALFLCGLKAFVMALAKCSHAQRQKGELRCSQSVPFNIKSP